MASETGERSEISFSQFNRELHVHLDTISYNELTASRAPIRVSRFDVYRLLKPYLTVRLSEQLRAVVPLAVYLALFQLLILRENIGDAALISMGLVAVIVGLMIFMEGLKVGLMPFGEMLGVSLPAKAGLMTVLVVVFLLGIGVIFAEPAIGALQTAGSLVDVHKAPYFTRY